MGELLSHAEIDAILSAVKPSVPQKSASLTSPTVRGVPLWERHDFRRPEPLRGSALEVIHALHSGFGQKAKTRLEALFHAQVEITGVGTCEATAAEFLASMKAEFTVCHLSTSENGPGFLLVWSTPLLQSLLTKMLGGQDQENEKLSTRPVTSIEKRLLSKLNVLLLRDLTDLLRTELTLADLFQNTQSMPHQIQRGSSIWLSFEMECDGHRDLIHLGLPRSAINQRTTSAAASTSVEMEPGLVFDSIPHGIQKVTVGVSANLAQLRIRTSDAATLQIGDILMTDLRATEPITLRLEDQVLCQAVIGIHSGRKAVRLIQTPDYRHPSARDHEKSVDRGEQ